MDVAMGAVARLTRDVMGRRLAAYDVRTATRPGRAVDGSVNASRALGPAQGRSLNRSTSRRSPETMMTSPGTTTVSGVA
ncbi:hypothetical protein GCM10027270_00970 [Nocardioides ginkgobilobae]